MSADRIAEIEACHLVPGHFCAADSAIAYLLAEVKRYRDAFAAAEGLWISPDGHGAPTIWLTSSTGDPVPVACNDFRTHRRIWAIIAAVIPERES